MSLKSVLLLGLVLFCQVLGKPIESSTESSSSNDILDAVTSAVSSTTSSENALRNEVLPTKALISASLRFSEDSPGRTNTSTTESIPIFNRTRVQLDIPNELVPYTMKLTDGLFGPLGNLMRRSLVRIAQEVRFFQRLFGNHLMVVIPKNLDV